MANPSAARALLASAVDYAGLFPPAALSMKQAVSSYLEYRQETDPWMLGSFVAPIGRISELEAVVEVLLRQSPRTVAPLPVSVLLGPNPRQTAVLVEPLREKLAKRLEIGAVEVAPVSPSEIEFLSTEVPSDLSVYFELPVDELLEERLSAVADAGDCAKIRAGGVTRESILSVAEVARFIALCQARSVPFKATAGLHHAIRGPQPLTYEPDSERAWMHGFVNLSLGTTLLHAGAINQAELVETLSESSPEVFRFERRAIHWRDRTIETEAILDARRTLFHSFGSCSYREPVSEYGDLSPS